MVQRILVITDCSDIAANELRATLVSNIDNLGAEIIVEPIVTVKEFSVLHGSFAARLLVDSYDPSSLTILAVVNPLNTATTKRARIAGRLNNGAKIVGANTGIFSWLINDFGIEELCETNPIGLKGEKFISFGGKYIHAPIAAKLAATNNLSSVKVNDFRLEDLVKLEYIKGTVVHIDNFGVIKLYYKDGDLKAKQGDKYSIKKNGEFLNYVTYCHSMKELKDGDLSLYKGSSLELLEIGLVRRLDTAGKLGVSVGDVIEIIQS